MGQETLGSMTQSDNRLARFKAHHETLLTGVRDQRDAVLNPSSDFTQADYAEYLRDNVLPHASREEEMLYTRVDELVQSDIATAGLRVDHTEIERRIAALETREPDGASVPLQLHELTAIVELHFRKEEEVLVPFLQDAIEPKAFEALLARLVDEA